MESFPVLREDNKEDLFCCFAWKSNLDLCKFDLTKKTKPQPHTYAYTIELESVVYEVGSVLVAQSRVVLPQQVGELVPATVLIVDQVVPRHVRVHLHPAHLLSYMHAV